MNGSGKHDFSEEFKKRIEKARTLLVCDNPFFGYVALNFDIFPMEMLRERKAELACVTARKEIYINEEKAACLTDGQLMFLLAHECMHLMLEHLTRIGNREHRRWNEAGDYVINQILVDDRVGEFIEGCLLNRKLVEAGGWCAEGVYGLLHRKDDLGEVGGIGEDIIPANASDRDIKEVEQEIKAIAAQAAQTARMHGDLSSGVSRLVRNILEPGVDWADLLRRFIIRIRDDGRSFERPSRRFVSRGLYLPVKNGEGIGEIVFAIDASGSITDDELNRFMAECRSVHEDLCPTRLHIISFDADVTNHVVLEPDDEFHHDVRGKGGTRFSPVFKYLEEHEISPEAVVFLTDLCSDDFGDDPEYPVLWVSVEKGEPPFGELVVMNREEW